IRGVLSEPLPPAAHRKPKPLPNASDTITADLGARTPIVPKADGQLAPLYARHAFALDTKDADGLEGCGRDFEALGALLSATDAFAHAAAQHEADGNRSNAIVAATCGVSDRGPVRGRHNGTVTLIGICSGAVD